MYLPLVVASASPTLPKLLGSFATQPRQVFSALVQSLLSPVHTGPASPPIGLLAFGQNIRIAMSPLGTPGEIDRQSASGVLQQDSTLAPEPDTAPALPQAAPPEARVAPAVPVLPVGDVEPELTGRSDRPAAHKAA